MGQTKQTRHVCPLCSPHGLAPRFVPESPSPSGLCLKHRPSCISKLHVNVPTYQPFSERRRSRPRTRAPQSKARCRRLQAKLQAVHFILVMSPDACFARWCAYILQKRNFAARFALWVQDRNVRACVRRTVRVASSLPANLIPELMIGFSALKSVSAVRN